MKRSNHWGPDSLIADPHLAKNFEQLSLRVKCGNIIEFHQKLVRNLLSFYDADDLTKTPRGSFGRGGCTNQTGSKPKDVLDEFENRMPKRFAMTQVLCRSNAKRQTQEQGKWPTSGKGGLGTVGA